MAQKIDDDLKMLRLDTMKCCFLWASCHSDAVPGVLEALPGGAGVRVGHRGVSGAGRAVPSRI